MANEINAKLPMPLFAGATVIAQLWQNNAQVGSDIALVEGVAGLFTGDAPILTAGEYNVFFYVDVNMVAAGVIYWDGTQEISFAQYMASLSSVALIHQALREPDATLLNNSNTVHPLSVMGLSQEINNRSIQQS